MQLVYNYYFIIYNIDNHIKDDGLKYLCDKCRRGFTVYLKNNKSTDIKQIISMFNSKHIIIGDSRNNL